MELRSKTRRKSCIIKCSKPGKDGRKERVTERCVLYFSTRSTAYLFRYLLCVNNKVKRSPNVEVLVIS